MKKMKKHFLILGLLLFLGVTVLTLNASALSGNLNLFGGTETTEPKSIATSSSSNTTNSIKSDTGSYLADIQPIAGGKFSGTVAKKSESTDSENPTNLATSIQAGQTTDGSQQSIQAVSVSGTASKQASGQPVVSTNSQTTTDSSQQKQPAKVDIASVTLDKTNLQLKKGEAADLSATVSPSNTTLSKTVTWFSTNSNVATVDESGKVSAVEGGTAMIIASTSNGRTAICTVSVSVPSTSVTLNLTDIDMERGDMRVLTPSIQPTDTTDTVSWKSSNSSVATVDSNGRVIAAAPGTALITATAGTISASCRVTVGISISQVILNEKEITIKKGESQTLSAYIYPQNTTENTSITWSSSDKKIAAVNEKGEITAVEGGKAIITAKAGTHTAQCTVNVIVPATGIKLSDTDVERGTTKALVPVFTPDDATDRTATWTSSNQDVATVDSSGKVTGLKIGQTTITAVSHDGGFTAKCTVTVIVPISEVKLSQTEITLKKGDTTALTATILPADTTENRTVDWSTSDPKVATVDETGKIIAVEGGSAIITATVGSHKVTCHVQVIVPLTGIQFELNSVKLPLNTDMQLGVIFEPSDATDTALKWTSDNPDVATVDDSGKIHGNATGSATITATSHDGGYTAQCAVTVYIPVTGITLDQASLNLLKGQSQTLSAKITPKDATDQTYAWSSSDSSVASVDQSGNVTAVEGGTATITATSHDGNFAASCTVVVTVPVTGIKLDKTTLSLPTGGSYTLIASLIPSDATDTDVAWSSNNQDVISVDENGTVTAHTETGTAIITATAHDGGFSAQCTVTISNTPSAPQKLAAVMSGDTTIKLTWDAPADDGHSPITGYKVSVNGHDYTTTINSYSVSCPSNTTFTITVSGANANGYGPILSKTYKSTASTRYWTSTDTVTSWGITGSHQETDMSAPAVWINEDGGYWGYPTKTVYDYGWVTHNEEVEHSATYYTISEVIT